MAIFFEYSGEAKVFMFIESPLILQMQKFVVLYASRSNASIDLDVLEINLKCGMEHNDSFHLHIE